MSGSYEALGLVYDELTKNVGYEKRAAFVDSTLRQNNISGIVLDAGCGTGTLTLLLEKCGYEMIGADFSENMLAVAAQKKHGAIVFLNQELSKLDLYGTVNAVVCMQDTLNHIVSLDRLQCVFDRFALFTERGGMLIFDVNTSYKSEHVLGSNSFVFETEKSFCVWQNEYSKRKKAVKVTFDVFVCDCGKGYRRMTDEFWEYDYSDKLLRQCLEKAGYSLLEVLDGETYMPIQNDSQRALYIAKRL
ncbi:MAG: class I SAM-dependent methyltransferase [Oscillospiraceae bacterium]